MLTVDLKNIKDCADHLLTLAGIMGHPMSKLRASHFRSCERSLAHLHQVFHPELALQLKEWDNARKAVAAMHETLSKVTELEKNCDHLQTRMLELESDLSKWKALSPSSKQRLKNIIKDARKYLETGTSPLDENLAERFELFQNLKTLVPYAEEVDHLCAAIKHYSKRDEYEAEKKDLEAKIVSAEIRMKSVKRGFVLSLILCVAIVTLPLCLPFSFSLWNRLREIDKQQAQLIESRRRLLRKLELADEGVIAAEDITAVLGERSLSDVRGVLEEVRTLNREFSCITERTPLFTRLLISIREETEVIDSLFGEGPLLFKERLSWLIRSFETCCRKSNEIFHTANDLISLRNNIKSSLKGYNLEILRDTLVRLEDRMEELMSIEVSHELGPQFARLCKMLPTLLSRVQLALSKVSYGQDVSFAEWQRLSIDVVTASTTLNAIAIDGELSRFNQIQSGGNL